MNFCYITKLLLILSIVNIGLINAFHQKTFNLNKPIQNPEQQYLYDQKQYYFDQLIDHYNYQSSSTWSQRYFAIEDYFNPNVGPVFLFICGQYTCPGVPASRQWVVQLARQYQGLILVLQHRFYGKSMPFGNQSLLLDNMKYLNSQQALSDLAYFIIKVKQNNMFRVNKNPWITVGGSYPGAMSAWFRYKYPHLTIGAIASSAVIKAIQNFPQFDQQIYTSSMKSGNSCMLALNKSHAKVQSILKSSQGQSFKSSFEGGQKLKNNQFMFFWADFIVLTIQYGGRTQLCNALKNKSQQQQFSYLTQKAKANAQVYEYGSYYLSNISFQIERWVGSRSWYYQSCTQFGFWQTPSKAHPMRSSMLDLNFYRQFCQNSFGKKLWPKVNQKNAQYGGFDQQSTNLLMANGDQDPWRWASLQQSKGGIISRVAECDNCAHCVDLYTPSLNDSLNLKVIRTEQNTRIGQWINDYWSTNKQKTVRFEVQLHLRYQ